MPRRKPSPVERECPTCDAVFTTTDTRKKYCSRSCKAKHLNNLSDAVDHRGIERQATQEWIYEQVFSTQKSHRADVVMALLVYAATSGAKNYRDLMTYPTAQRSNRFTAKERGTAGLHFQGRPFAYPATIAAMANHVCKHHLGITSRTFIDEVKRDKVTLEDMAEVYHHLMDREKAEPVIKGCDPEGCAYKDEDEGLTVAQIAHARLVLSDPFAAARRCVEIVALAA